MMRLPYPPLFAGCLGHLHIPARRVGQLPGPYGVQNFSAIYGNIQTESQPYKVRADVIAARAENGNVYRLVEAYRKYGHQQADINPIPHPRCVVSELDPSLYGLNGSALCSCAMLSNGCTDNLPLEQFTQQLKTAYCGPVTAEFMHLPSEAERDWFAAQLEGDNLHSPLDTPQKLELCRLLLASQSWDQFLASKFPGVKRYGGEGAEGLMSYYLHTMRALATKGVSHAVLGMAHRGRLNLLTGLLQVPPQMLFRKMRGRSEHSEQFTTTGDVLSHINATADLQFPGCASALRVELLANPSHLEAINPVVAGRTRALHRALGVGQYGEGRGGPVCLQIHGDAAVASQGVVQETLGLATAPHCGIGGTLHVIVNNQIGFTTPTLSHAVQPSDVALLQRLPIIRVNGDRVESVARAAALSVSYQQLFQRDVFVDVLCWRRHGHNELDDPRFTNPLMYRAIDGGRSVPDKYADQLIMEGVLTDDEKTAMLAESAAWLTGCYNDDKYEPKATSTLSSWSGLQQCQSDAVHVWDTGVDEATLMHVATTSVSLPTDFFPHPHLVKHHVGGRLAKLSAASSVDWATAEAMAFGSLIMQGFGIRLCGQDVGRGTFSQRHCVLIDQSTEDTFVPLNELSKVAKMEVVNSILSEEAVLGFEYGLSLNNKDTLHIWEAQFGDFFNGAQIMIDTFISSGEAKWLYQSGLVLLLPHGFDGAGPEHSSCRVERFLAGSDSTDDRADSSCVNWAVVSPTTPAQYFHALRQQMVRPYRKPLIVVGPKAVLRLQAATSPLSDMAPGTHFQPVIDDTVAPLEVRRVVLVSGKHYYALLAERAKRARTQDTALVRVESLCPFPAHEINAVIAKYSNATSLVWAQEEPRNMGAWPFMFPRILNICGAKIAYAGRPAAAAPAVGAAQNHTRQAAAVMEDTFGV